MMRWRLDEDADEQGLFLMPYDLNQKHRTVVVNGLQN